MKSSLCLRFITLSILFIFPYQCVSARASEKIELLRDLAVRTESAEHFQEKSTSIEKSSTQEQRPSINLQDYVGRYQADPSVMENFILDVFVEKDQLWIKPSHEPKSQLVAKSTDSFVSTAINVPITFDVTQRE